MQTPVSHSEPDPETQLSHARQCNDLALAEAIVQSRPFTGFYQEDGQTRRVTCNY